ncbi:PEP-CTERM sorting domain-containing protein [Bradyrhizobium sp. Tv2a-2]|uniref:PEP-CTERM sorting domain-containing protein n=1 Tax=Bradyrhizobium sp. Tv2a-2 TaxID=113395 RepID=UPI000463D671|nr:PEP-CTERM sorting domain-containing protein [Bradyrhizobium sp. Tv2a-2]
MSSDIDKGILAGLLLGTSLLLSPNQASASVVTAPTYNYTVSGSYQIGVDPPITGTLTVVGGPTDKITSVDIVTPNFGTFTKIVSQGFSGADYDVELQDTKGKYDFFLVLDTASSLFGGTGAAIDRRSYFVAANDPCDPLSESVRGKLMVAAVPEPSTWAMMVLGFIGLASLGFQRKSRLRASAA